MSTQNETFTKYYDRVQNTKDGKELGAIGKEIYAADDALKEEGRYLFSKEEKKIFWDLYNNKKAEYRKAWGAEQNKLRTDEYLEKVNLAKGNLRRLEEIRSDLHELKYMNREEKLPIYKVILGEINSIKQGG